MKTASQIVTAAEAAERLGVTVVTVPRWIKSGRLKALRSDPYLLDRAEIERMAAELLAEAEARVAWLRGGMCGEVPPRRRPGQSAGSRTSTPTAP